MAKIKKVHKVIFLFVLIFLLGVYSFSLYISNTLDKKNETINESEINGSATFGEETLEIN